MRKVGPVRCCRAVRTEGRPCKNLCDEVCLSSPGQVFRKTPVRPRMCRAARLGYLIRSYAVRQRAGFGGIGDTRGRYVRCESRKLLFSERRPGCSHGRYKRVTRGHESLPVGYFGYAHAGESPGLHGRHAVELSPHEHLDGVMAELRAQHPIAGAGCAPALDVAENGRPTFQSGALGDLLAEHLADPAQTNRIG